ncbi:hypothetical protein EGW08_002949 [Elysia chlorotica]|uniref:Uncharacterized protein n=1 Tax=Elysia chlorotica TaxID=188477 RepID=A0A433U622_ELYCH|nr:hypothetical protein EGW08_002949 [Elysia chlorotica]
MSGVTLVSKYSDDSPFPDYFLPDALGPSHKEVATQVSAEQVDRKNPLEDGVSSVIGEDSLMQKGMLEHYLQSATIHGVAQTQGPHFYHHRRPLWLVLIVIMATLLGYTLFCEISHLYEYPARTVTRVRLKDELTFPAVTICNMNQFNIDRVPDIPIVKLLFYLQSDYARLAKGKVGVGDLPNLSNMSDVSGEELHRITRYAAPRLDELLVQCTLFLKTYNCSDLFLPIQTGFGSCYVFNGPDVESHNLVKATNISRLRVLAVLDSDKSYFSRLIHAGLKVQIHEADEHPFPEFDGYYVRPGVAALMALSRTDSIALPPPYKAYSNSFCVDTRAEGFVHSLEGYKTYTRNHCIKQCILDKLYRNCGCGNYFTGPNYGKSKVLCSAKQLLVCYIFQAGSLGTEDLEQCPCPKECHTVTYSADVSYANIASMFVEQQALKDNLTIFTSSLRENVVDLTIFFKTLNILENEQEPEMSLVSILGDLGGQMGLFLGASILSVTELAEFVLLWTLTKIRLFCSRIRRRLSVGPSTDNLHG